MRHKASSSRSNMTRLGWTTLLAGVLLVVAGCVQDMRNEGRFEPMEAAPFFPDNQLVRPLPDGVVARDIYVPGDPVYTGLENGQLATTIPVSVTAELLERGQQQFNIFCSPCHGLDGYGDGVIVRHGFPRPPSYHTDRLRQAPAGHFFDVISNGFGVMFEYGSRVPPEDRWAIVAYIRALQLSQNISAEELSAEDLEQVNDAR